MFRKGSLRAQRLLVATETTCPEKLEDLSRQLWMMIWSRVCVFALHSGMSQLGALAVSKWVVSVLPVDIASVH